MLNQSVEKIKNATLFSKSCRDLIARHEKPFSLIDTVECVVPMDIDYDNHFNKLRVGAWDLIAFGREISDQQFISTKKLAPGKTYKVKIIMSTKWLKTKTMVSFCKLQDNAILAGPHGLALALKCVGDALPACRLLVSFDEDDANMPRINRILSAGRCENGNWELSIHSGEWAPGTFLAIFFEV